MGLWMIYVLLRAYSRRELVMNKELRWTYGLGVWLLAGLGAWAAVEFYHVYPL